MGELTLPALAAWESFYVIFGSSAAALTGLQFVVIVLAAEFDIISGSAIPAFSTPTIVHFCMVLLISAVMSAPWHTLSTPGFCLMAVGVAGLVYSILTINKARRQKGYVPVLEDWLWHFLFPIFAYIALTISGLIMAAHTTLSLFTTGAVSIALLFTGIHNSWDSVTYIAVNRKKDSQETIKA